MRDLERISQDVKEEVIIKSNSRSNKDMIINIECMKILLWII